MTAPAKTRVVEPCKGIGVVTVIVDGAPGYDYIACPGCPQCRRIDVAARLAFRGKRRPADPFAGIPTDTDESF